MDKGPKVYVTTMIDWKGNELMHAYVERTLTLEQYRLEFGDGLKARKNQKTITVRETLTPEQVQQALDAGGTITSRNGGTK